MPAVDLRRLSLPAVCGCGVVLFASIAGFATSRGVVGSSMDPTLRSSDIVFVAPFHGECGDIVIGCLDLRAGRVVVAGFPEPHPHHVVKRVVALGGDTVAATDGQLIVNGRIICRSAGDCRVLERSEIIPGAWHYAHLLRPIRGYEPTGDTWGPIRVPTDSLFLLGDNTSVSEDSRSYGPVPISQVEGLVFGQLPTSRIVALWR